MKAVFALFIACLTAHITHAQGFVVWPPDEYPAPPTVTIEATDSDAAEPGPDANPGAFTITRTGNTEFGLRVYYGIGGSASNGVDYAAIPAQYADIPAGQSSVLIQINPIDNLIPEGKRKVLLQLTHPPFVTYVYPYRPPYQITFPSWASVYIADNDGGPANRPPTIELLSLTNSQVIAQHIVPLRANASDPDGDVVRIEFFEGTNSIGIISNPPGNEFVYVGPIPLVVGYLIAPPVWTPAPGDYVLTAVATDNDGASTVSEPAHVTVIPLPVITIDASDAHASEPGGGQTPNRGTFTVTRTGDTSNELTVFFGIGGTAVLGQDYHLVANGAPDWTSSGGSIHPFLASAVIPAGEASVKLWIHPLHDRLPEETETVTVSLSHGIFPLDLWPATYTTSAKSATLEPPLDLPLVPALKYWFGPPYDLGEPSSATVFIRQNDGWPRNRLPKVKLTQPHKGDVFPRNTPITIEAQTVDRESYVTKVEFFDSFRKIGEVMNESGGTAGTPVPFTLIWADAPAGLHILRARATDTQGGVRISSPVRIRIGR